MQHNECERRHNMDSGKSKHVSYANTRKLRLALSYGPRATIDRLICYFAKPEEGTLGRNYSIPRFRCFIFLQTLGMVYSSN